MLSFVIVRSLTVGLWEAWDLFLKRMDDDGLRALWKVLDFDDDDDDTLIPVFVFVVS